MSPSAGRGRHESDDERADRMWDEMLQELRVMQTGAQLIAGFLLTLPFQSAFTDLSTTESRIYLVLVVLSILLALLVMTPLAIHRRITGQHIKPRLVAVSQQLLIAVLTCLSLLVTGIAAFLFHVVLGPMAAIVVGAGFGVAALTLLVVVPFAVDRSDGR
jgi:hypothetical protein